MSRLETIKAETARTFNHFNPAIRNRALALTLTEMAADKIGAHLSARQLAQIADEIERESENA